METGRAAAAEPVLRLVNHKWQTGAAVQAGHVSTSRQQNRAVLPAVLLVTVTEIVRHLVLTRPPQAGLVPRTFVNLRLAEFAFIPGPALAAELVDAVLTVSVQAGTRGAVVDVCLAVGASVARQTETQVAPRRGEVVGGWQAGNRRGQLVQGAVGALDARGAVLAGRGVALGNVRLTIFPWGTGRDWCE